MVLFFAQCIPPQEEDPGIINVDFKESNIQHVINLGDKQEKDSLLIYLKSESPTLRYYALKGLANLQDSSVIDQVAVLLDDPIERNQSLAAYVIGLTGSSAGTKYLIQAFASSDTISARRPPNEYVLEALGRCGTIDVLKNIASVSTFIPTDTALVNGRSKAIYRFALREIVLPIGTQKMLEVAIDNNYPRVARLYASAYLARTKGIEFNSDQSHKLLKAFTQGSDQEKMLFAQALKKSADSTIFVLLKNKYGAAQHPGVKTTILRVLSDLPYLQIRELYFEALENKSPEVSSVAIDWFLDKGTREDASYYALKAKTIESPKVQVGLLTAGLKNISRLDSTQMRSINRNLRGMFEKTNDPYVQAKILHGLAEFPWNFRFIRRESAQSEYKVVQVAGIEALDKLLRSKNYLKSIGGYRKGLKRELITFFVEAIQSGDVGKRAAAAIALRNDDPEFRAIVLDSTVIRVLESAVRQEPKDIESHNEILQTIATLKGTKYVPITPTNNHPIDWFQLEGVSQEVKMKMSTSKGDIEFVLYPEESPGTVASFLKEAKRKYYNNKTFHRVVPNFVIQGGCPRGDGYGSLDYTLRSEFFPFNYDEAGYIGMASAGKDTEGVQFFITHSAAPHLDGKYTIFGKVVKGMDVVHSIEVGDQILTISQE